MSDIANITSKNIAAPAQAYNTTHYYQSFELDIATGSSVLGNYTTNALGWITPTEGAGSGTNSSPVNMIPLDANLHDTTSAQFAVESLLSSKLYEQDRYFQANLAQYKITPGLSFKVYQSTQNTTASNSMFMKTPNADIPTNNVVSKGQSDDFSSFTSSIKTTSFGQQTSPLFVEWFGYFMTPTSGNYNFQTTSSQPIKLWFGDMALTNFNDTNVTSNNSGKKQQVSAIAGKYYPIRIKYLCTDVQQSFSMAVNFNGQLIPNSRTMFFTINDSTGTQYEPIQIHYALSQNNSDTAAEGLYQVTITAFDIINNYTNNQQLRAAISNSNLLYKSTTIITCNSNNAKAAQLKLETDGNMTLSNGFTTTTMKINPRGDSFTNCIGGTNFQSPPAITLNNHPVNQYYTVTEDTKVDTKTGLSYTSYAFSGFNYNEANSDPLFTVVQNLQNTPSSQAMLNTDYKLGNESINKAYTQPIGQSVTISNLDKMKMCSFTLNLMVGGNISITNGNGQVWDLFTDSAYTNIASQVQAMIQSAKQNPEWMNIYTASKQSGKDLQYLNAGNTLDAGNPLYSSDGKCKLTVDSNNNLVILITKILDTSRTFTNSGDPPNTYYLFSTKGDMKIGKHMLVDTSNHTMQYVPLSSNILNFLNTYTDYTGKYSYPPNTTDIKGMTKTDGMSQAECQASCDKTEGCNYYYSYKTHDNSTHCIVNTDNGTPVYLPSPNQSEVKSSAIYLRDKVVESSCNINGYQPKIKTAITSSQFTSYNAYSANMESYDPEPEKEGACGDPNIAQSLGIFNGKAAAQVEGFVQGYKADACQTGNSQDCIRDISANLAAINAQSATIQNNNTKINQQFHSINDKVYGEYTRLYNKVNNNSNYDMANPNGALLNQEHTLLNGMIEDTRNNMISQNTFYIFANIAVTGALLGLLTMIP
jgi:hypothetical protein